MTDPLIPRLEDILPGLHGSDMDASQPVYPPGFPDIYAPGENLDTLKYDHTPGIRDVRTPEQWKPVERILADQLAKDPNSLRLVQGYTLDFGAVALWEVLDRAGAVEEYVLASYAAGGNRLHLAYYKTLTVAEGKLALKRADMSAEG